MLITGADIAGVMNSYALPAFRIFAVFSIAPVLGTRIVPMRVACDFIAVGIAVIPLVAQTREVPAEFMAVVPEVVMELVIGLAIGFALGLCLPRSSWGPSYLLQMGLDSQLSTSRCASGLRSTSFTDAEHLNVSCAQRTSHVGNCCAELYLAADWR